MPITTARHVALLNAAKEAINGITAIQKAQNYCIENLGQIPDGELLAHLTREIDYAIPSRDAQVEIELAARIYTPAKVARNERAKEYMRERGGHLPLGSRGPSTKPKKPARELTPEEIEAKRISDEEDAKAEAQFDARISPVSPVQGYPDAPEHSRDIPDPPDAHLPLPPPKTGKEIRDEVLAKLK